MTMMRMSNDTLENFYDNLVNGEIAVPEHVFIGFYSDDGENWFFASVIADPARDELSRIHDICGADELESVFPRERLQSGLADATFECMRCENGLWYDRATSMFFNNREHSSCSGEYCEYCDSEICDSTCWATNFG